MWRITRITQRNVLVLLLVFGLIGCNPVAADVPTAVPSPLISQLKVTSSNGQFVTLYNPSSSALNMSNYQLEYFNSFDLSKATSSKLIPLSGTLPPHSYFMVNDGTLQLCYQMTIDSASLGFSTTAGLVEVLAMNQSAPGSLITASLQDYVGWSKTPASGAQTLPVNTTAFLLRQPVDAHNNPMVAVPGSGSWQAVQPDSNNACSLVSAANIATPVSTGLNQLLPATEPPATIVSADSIGSSTMPSPTLPAIDIGLMAPQITELLPNPNGTGNDSSDEFIELYNGNDSDFDLSGFSLQTGLTTLHSYIFPTGTVIAARSFTSFHSDVTKLTLSNSGSQAKLLDPFSNAIAASDVYGSATDGQSWALANGKWYWTIQPTPGEANVIKLPPVKISKSTSSKKTTQTVKAAKPTTAALKTRSSGTSSVTAGAATVAAVHPWMLALVAGGALLYGIYEYRLDLANRLRQSRAKLGTGSIAWPKFARWRGDRAGE